MKQLELFEDADTTYQKTTADQLKVAIMKSFIEDKGFEIAATEVHYCDILITNLKATPIVEIETKINWYDFLADFDKPKHQKYLKGEGMIPDFFFFGVPEYLVDRCQEYLQESEYNYYGLISVSSSGYVHTAMKAKRFPTNSISRQSFFQYLLKRCTRQLINLYEEKNEYNSETGNEGLSLGISLI